MEPRAAGMGMDSERESGRAGAARARHEVTSPHVHVHPTATLWVAFGAKICISWEKNS